MYNGEWTAHLNSVWSKYEEEEEEEEEEVWIDK